MSGDFRISITSRAGLAVVTELPLTMSGTRGTGAEYKRDMGEIKPDTIVTMLVHVRAQPAPAKPSGKWICAEGDSAWKVPCKVDRRAFGAGDGNVGGEARSAGQRYTTALRSTRIAHSWWCARSWGDAAAEAGAEGLRVYDLLKMATHHSGSAGRVPAARGSVPVAGACSHTVSRHACGCSWRLRQPPCCAGGVFGALQGFTGCRA
mgnify:CR=1 FL=1